MPPPDRQFRLILGFFLIVAVILTGVVLVALRNVARSADTNAWVNHTHATRAEAAGVLASLQAAEGALRTYLLTGDARDQADYRLAFAELAEHVEVAKALTRQTPEQHQQILDLERRLARRAELAREIVRLRAEGATEKLQALLAADAGKDEVREIGRFITRFRQEQAELLAARDRASFLQAQTTRWTVLAGLILDFLLLAGAAWLIRDDLRARHRAAEAMREANENLETRVRERTAELTAANAQLSAENLERQWAGQALEHQLRYNQLIVDSISDLVFVLTKSLNITRVNPAVRQLTGFESTAMINQPLAKVVRLDLPSPGEGAPLLDPLKQALKAGREIREHPALVTDSRGRQIPVRFTLFPLRDRDKVVGAIVTIQVSPPPAPRQYQS